MRFQARSRWLPLALLLSTVGISIGGGFRSLLYLLPLAGLGEVLSRIGGERLRRSSRSDRATSPRRNRRVGVQMIVVFAGIALISRSGNLASRLAGGDSLTEGRRGDELLATRARLTDASIYSTLFCDGLGATLVDETLAVQSTTVHNTVVGVVVATGLFGLATFSIFAHVILRASITTIRSGHSLEIAIGFTVLMGFVFSITFSVIWGEPIWAICTGYCLSRSTSLSQSVPPALSSLATTTKYGYPIPTPRNRQEGPS